MGPQRFESESPKVLGPRWVVVPRVRPSSGCPIARRYPILVVLLHETTLDLVGEIVDLLNRALKKTGSRSRRELEAWRVMTAQATNEKVRLFSRLGRLVLDPDIPDEQLRRRIFEEAASRELFAAADPESPGPSRICPLHHGRCSPRTGARWCQSAVCKSD